MYAIQEEWFDPETDKAKPVLDQYIKSRLEEAKKKGWLQLSLFNLIEHPLVTQALTVEDGKVALAKNVPFKLVGCNAATLCCGACTRLCTHRCVQDLLQRIQLICMTHPWVARTLEDPKFATYDHLLSLYNDYLRSVDRYGQHYDYGPAVEKVQKGSSGIYQTKIDPRSGTAVYDEWPVSGLCPFCLPKEAFYRKRRNRGERGIF